MGTCIYYPFMGTLDKQNALATLRTWNLIQDNSGPYRVYRDEKNNIYHSVTHILKETAPQHTKDALENWLKRSDSYLERVQVFSWTQKTITQQFDVISQLEDYEDMTECDFYLSREGQGTDTKYTVQAAPLKKAMAKAVDEAWEAEKEFDLERLLKGGNPFKEEE